MEPFTASKLTKRKKPSGAIVSSSRAPNLFEIVYFLFQGLTFLVFAEKGKKNNLLKHESILIIKVKHCPRVSGEGFSW